MKQNIKKLEQTIDENEMRYFKKLNDLKEMEYERNKKKASPETKRISFSPTQH
jgi:hypothetical protein